MSTKKGINEYLRQHRGYCSLFVVVMIFMAFIAPLKSFILQWLIDAKDKDEAIYYLFCGCVVIILNFSLNLLGNNMFSKIQTSSIEAIRNRAMRSLILREKDKQNEDDNAQFLSMFTNDMQIISVDYFESLYNIIFYGLLLFFSLLMYIYIDVSMLLFVAIAGISSVTMPRVFDKALAKSRSQYSEEIGKYTSVAKEVLYGVEVIRNFLVVDNYFIFHEKNSEKAKNADYRFNRLINLSNGVSSLVSNTLFFIVLLFGMFLVFDGKITLGYMVAATNLSNFVVAPCQVISSNYARYQASKKVVCKLEKILSTESRVVNNEKNILSEIKEIKVEKLSFRYTENSPEVLKKVDLYWGNTNRQIALIGESGSGKSTIARLLYKFSDMYKGYIKINDIDISQLNEQQIYRKIGYISQNTYIFNDTIRNNIALYEEYSETEIIDAIEKAGLLEYVESLPEGIDTLLSENGNNLSGGQIQRIALARTLLRKYQCIIADEITSNLDVETASQVMNNLLDSDMMILVITHDIRGEFMSRFDETYCSKNGILIKR